MNAFVLLFLAIASEVIGSAALKASDGFTKLWPSLIVVGGYGGAAYLLSLVLRKIPLGTTYAIWSGVGTVATAIIGILLYREPLDGWRALGILLVVSGVIVLRLLGATAA